MVVLDIIAPILLMLGIKHGTSSNASLLGNFEIVATTLIALLLFGEKVSKRLFAAIGLITIASAVLTLEGSGSFDFSVGSLLVLGAASCWGLENNCTLYRCAAFACHIEGIAVGKLFCSAHNHDSRHSLRSVGHTYPSARA